MFSSCFKNIDIDFIPSSPQPTSVIQQLEIRRLQAAVRTEEANAKAKELLNMRTQIELEEFELRVARERREYQNEME